MPKNGHDFPDIEGEKEAASQINAFVIQEGQGTSETGESFTVWNVVDENGIVIETFSDPNHAESWIENVLDLRGLSPEEAAKKTFYFLHPEFNR